MCTPWASILKGVHTYFKFAETKVAVAYAYCVFYVSWTGRMWVIPESYMVIAYFTANIAFAEGFASIAY